MRSLRFATPDPIGPSVGARMSDVTTPRSPVAVGHDRMAPMTGSSSEAPKPRRVLIAEDEALIRLDLAEMLKEEGYEVVGEAGGGPGAGGRAGFPQPHPGVLGGKRPRP